MSMLHVFSKFENDIVLKEKTAFVIDPFISGLIPFEEDGLTRDGEVSRSTILTFLNISSGDLKFTTDRKNENLVMKTESGASLKTPFKVIADHLDFPRHTDVLQTITINWEEFSKVLNLAANIAKMGTVTAHPETLGVVFEGNSVYSTDLSGCFVYFDLEMSTPIEGRYVFNKPHVKIILEWMKAFGDPSVLNIYPDNIIQIVWQNGAILSIQCPYISKPLPLNKIVEKALEKEKIEFSKEFKNVILEISRLDNKLEIDGKLITSSKSNSYSYKHELKYSISDSRCTIYNLPEINKFAELTDYISNPIDEITVMVSADKKIMYIFSPKFITQPGG